MAKTRKQGVTKSGKQVKAEMREHLRTLRADPEYRRAAQNRDTQRRKKKRENSEIRELKNTAQNLRRNNPKTRERERTADTSSRRRKRENPEIVEAEARAARLIRENRKCEDLKNQAILMLTIQVR